MYHLASLSARSGHWEIRDCWASPDTAFWALSQAQAPVAPSQLQVAKEVGNVGWALQHCQRGLEVTNRRFAMIVQDPQLVEAAPMKAPLQLTPGLGHWSPLSPVLSSKCPLTLSSAPPLPLPLLSLTTCQSWHSMSLFPSSCGYPNPLPLFVTAFWAFQHIGAFSVGTQ